ncbi:MAG: hypothetical protein CFE44_03065 [Burkholderiales bacterium PBB4]|nr:MAG: hypothetical protein CFE44_03065 [Burkholderiales bacterium PBB4]
MIGSSCILGGDQQFVASTHYRCLPGDHDTTSGICESVQWHGSPSYRQTSRKCLDAETCIDFKCRSRRPT